MPDLDENALVGQMAAALGLAVSSAIAATGDPGKGWALFERAVVVVRERAAEDGLVPRKRTHTRVDDLKPEETGIVAIRHDLGSERVTVKLFAADGAPRKHRRMGVPISVDEVEVIAESQDVAYAEVTVIGE
jgi:hypothetical protein